MLSDSKTIGTEKANETDFGLHKLVSGVPYVTLREPGVPCSIAFYAVSWRETIDLTELAHKRWVEKLSSRRISQEMGWSYVTVIRALTVIRRDPNLVKDGAVRKLVKLTSRRFVGAP